MKCQRNLVSKIEFCSIELYVAIDQFEQAEKVPNSLNMDHASSNTYINLKLSSIFDDILFYSKFLFSYIDQAVLKKLER